MPQVDTETLVSSVCTGGSDRKIACETLADDDSTHETKIRPVSVPDESPIDFPPESYSLSKEAQVKWLNENAFFERKESQKGNSSSAPNSIPNSSSQRISLKSKTSIIRLPKPQKTCFNETSKRRNCRIARTLMIPKRIGSLLRSESEPSSPKVSCIGRVTSKRDRSRQIQRQKSGRTNSFNRSGSSKDKPARVKKLGFFASFRAIFRRTAGGCKDLSVHDHAPQRDDTATPPKVSARRSSDIRCRLPAEEVGKSSPPRNSIGSRRSLDGNEPELPGLGGMVRFTSGRRPDLLVEV